MQLWMVVNGHKIVLIMAYERKWIELELIKDHEFQCQIIVFQLIFSIHSINITLLLINGLSSAFNKVTLLGKHSSTPNWIWL